MLFLFLYLYIVYINTYMYRLLLLSVSVSFLYRLLYCCFSIVYDFIPYVSLSISYIGLYIVFLAIVAKLSVTLIIQYLVSFFYRLCCIPPKYLCLYILYRFLCSYDCSFTSSICFSFIGVTVFPMLLYVFLRILFFSFLPLCVLYKL